MDKYYQFGFWFLFLMGMYPTYLALMDGGRTKLGNALEAVFMVMALGLWPFASMLMMIVKTEMDRR